MSKKKYYSPEFKQEAVRLAEACGNKSQLARDLGIHATMICKWQGLPRRSSYNLMSKEPFPGLGSQGTKKWLN